MSTKDDIESEIGKNGWRLVGKIMVGVIGALAVKTALAGIILAQWKGEISTKMDRAILDVADNRAEISKVKDRVSVLEGQNYRRPY